MDHDKPQIILASSSPRRQQLLEQIGMRFVVLPVNVDEVIMPGESPEHYVVRLAAEKSFRGLQSANQELPVLGADTVVVVDNQALGKPTDRSGAVAMLTRLAGREHRVLSAVSLRAENHWQALSSSTVLFRKIDEQEMLAYWNSGEPRDKAGGYAIQGIGALFVARIEGSFSGVMGLPLFEVAELLKKAGISVLLQQDK